MLTGSLKVTPLAALSRFSNLKQEIIKMKKCKKFLLQFLLFRPAAGVRGKTIIVNMPGSSKVETQYYPPRNWKKNKGDQAAAAFSPKSHSRNTSFLSFSKAVKECFSFLAPALPHAVALLKEEKAEVIYLHEGFVL